MTTRRKLKSWHQQCEPQSNNTIEVCYICNLLSNIDMFKGKIKYHNHFDELTEFQTSTHQKILEIVIDKNVCLSSINLYFDKFRSAIEIYYHLLGVY